MQRKTTFLRSKVARRIFALFILCALLPVGVLAVLSFREVTQQLEQQSRKELRQASRTQGMSLLERLRFLDGTLRSMATDVRTGARERLVEKYGSNAEIREHFEAMAIFPPMGAPQTLFGAMEMSLQLTTEEQDHVRAGKTLLVSHTCPGQTPCVWMLHELDPDAPEQGLLAGRVNLTYLSAPSKLSEQIEVYVFDAEDRVLLRSDQSRPDAPMEVLQETKRAPAGQLVLHRRDGDHLADYWTMFLRPQYGVPRWIVAVSLPRNDILAPLESFKRIFPLVMLLAFWVVLFLSLIQIRKSLVPLEKLGEGTKRIAARDFASPVQVNSADEFQELAASFNNMAAQLGRQFRALETVNEIDRAILSSWDTEKIVDALFARLPQLLPVEGMSLTLVPAGAPVQAQTYTVVAQRSRQKEKRHTPLLQKECDELAALVEVHLGPAQGEAAAYLAPLRQAGMQAFLVVPILSSGQLSGILVLGYSSQPSLGRDDMFHMRQAADQIAVALANAALIEELELLSTGTLTALARAIDAKSPWTAGHSERVTYMAIQIGRRMGLPPAQLKILHRGGLLHDIGKIGISAMILDKPGRLTPEEFNQMKDHVRLGARILEPISGFADLLPIVLYHHERYDGTGYPEGLAGEQIPLHARIFAVADVYDALSSDRPYRPGMPHDEVLNFFREKAGSQFDPRVVEVILKLLSEEAGQAEPEAEPDMVSVG